MNETPKRNPYGCAAVHIDWLGVGCPFPAHPSKRGRKCDIPARRPAPARHIIVLMYIYFRRKYPKLTPLQRKIQHYALLGFAAVVGFCVFCILLFVIFLEMLGTPLG